ncbi:hypothetical protein DH2020_015970 [Rehmannia glutinosa]|uniref:Uncharacterized protein n=1 Tax=Rehmannia glutinosa TaxID=99300 RepID=A0ABR0WVT4_REHGL
MAYLIARKYATSQIEYWIHRMDEIKKLIFGQKGGVENWSQGLLGVVFAVATLADEAVNDGEIGYKPMHNLVLPLPNSYALSQVEAIILDILKGYQAFTQACGVLRAVEPLNSILASLCKFTIYIPNEAEKRRLEGVLVLATQRKSILKKNVSFSGKWLGKNL